MKSREREIHGLDASVYDTSPEADAERKLCKEDFKYFLKEVFFHGNADHQGKLGKIHDLLIDFMRLHELEKIAPYQHSDLHKYLPPRDADGEFPERWIYWRTFDEAPQVEDGDGQIAKLFHEGEWSGVIIRLRGDGHDKAVLTPRGHLKSTICSEAHTAWEIIRSPWLRHIILSQKQGLATKMVGSVKGLFQSNEQFRRLFENLGPPKKNEGLIWSSTAVQVRTKERRGQECTLTSYSVGTEVTGVHADHVKCDDVVGQKNVNTVEQRQKVREKIQNLDAVRDPGSFFTDIGTIWSYDDAHREYIRRDGHSYDFTSFIVATVRMADDKPLWPEKFSDKVIRKLAKKYAGDIYFFKCQYYNQPNSGAARVFKPEWIRTYEAPPAQLVREKQLDIYITCDPASSDKKKSDFSACIVQGQAENGEWYVLDGFRDHLAPHALPVALADIITRWQNIAHLAGVGFRFGVEAVSFQLYVKAALENELRRRGASCFVEELTHHYKSKGERVKLLAAPYSMGMVFWPRTMPKDYASGEGGYDLIEHLRDEFLRFGPKSFNEHDDMIDAQAYGALLMRPVDEPLEEKQVQIEAQWKAYSREPDAEELSHAAAAERPRFEPITPAAYSRAVHGMSAWRTSRRY